MNPRISAMPLKRIKAQPRTEAEIADEEKARKSFRDRPSVKTLIERGELDPDRIMTTAAQESLLQGLIELKLARQSRGLSLSEISRRSGIDLACLSRLEAGKNPTPTFETLSRYAEAMDLRLDLALVARDVPLSNPVS
jgi:DNA-binding Xre family transcriptional regulator